MELEKINITGFLDKLNYQQIIFVSLKLKN